MGDDLPIYEDWATDYAALGNELLARLALGDDVFVATSALGDPAARRAVASLRALATQPAHAGDASAAFLRAFAGWGGAKGGA